MRSRASFLRSPVCGPDVPVRLVSPVNPFSHGEPRALVRAVYLLHVLHWTLAGNRLYLPVPRSLFAPGELGAEERRWSSGRGHHFPAQVNRALLRLMRYLCGLPD